MKLCVIILCLLSERFLIHSLSYKRFIWFDDYCKKISQHTKNYTFHSPWVLLLIFVLPIVVLVSIIYFLFHGIFFGIFGFLLHLGIFFYCLGPQNPFYPVTDEKAHDTTCENYFAKVNGELFAVIFWYILAGPIVILFYRLVTLCCSIDSVGHEAKQLRDLLEWLPARLSMLLFLLVGNFQKAFPYFLQVLPQKPALNDEILGKCGMQALQTSDGEGPTLADAEKLVEHAAFVLVVFIALFTLMAWL